MRKKREIFYLKKQILQLKLNWIQIHSNLNENEITIYSNLWDVGKGVLKGKFGTLDAYIRKQKSLKIIIT